MRVLIADDDPVAREVLARTLTRWEYDVTVTCDGAEAWEVLQRPDSPPLAILDWMMPKMKGPEVCHKVRHASVDARIYIILLTSRDARADIVEGLSYGADDYLVKPFNQDELQARVRVGARVLGLQERLAARAELLQSALSLVKQLSVQLPACAYCNGSSSDEDYRRRVEAFVAEHPESSASHFICPPCFDRIASDLDELARVKSLEPPVA